MALTGAQLATLKTNIAASEFSGLPNNSDTATTIAAAYNLQASPDWTVWRTHVSRDEVMLNGFDWTRVDNLSVGKARIWDWLFNSGFINPSKTNIRAGIEATWVGTQPDLDVRAAVYVHCKKLASRAQKLFSSGTGSNAVPATMEANIAEGFMLEASDVEIARALP